MLYLPKNRDPTKPLPTLVWIYPAEFSDEEYAEQMDSRRFRYHQIKEASPIAAVLDGYALLLNPTVPIIGEGADANDAYQEQLVSSMEAAVDYLVDNGISDRDRIAVAGRSYGAFSTANLLAHSDLFKTGIAISGAYNRTLTPFGFQHEKRSLWDAASFYTRMSPFYFADQINEPFLIMHGGADDNPGTRHCRPGGCSTPWWATGRRCATWSCPLSSTTTARGECAAYLGGNARLAGPDDWSEVPNAASLRHFSGCGWCTLAPHDSYPPFLP